MKKHIIFQKILIILLSLIFAMSAYSKFSSNESIVEMLTKLNLVDYKNALGVIDIIIALSLWTKKTRSIGIMIGTAYLGGAIASEFSLGGTGLVPALCILALWVIQKIDLWDCNCGKCETCIKKSSTTTVSNI